MNSLTEKQIKIIIVGDGGVGKTTFINKHKTGEFKKKYITTVGVEVTNIIFYTNIGKMICNCWDTPGQEQYGGLRDGYYIGADAAIIMFDVTARVTYKSVPYWYKDIKKVCGNIPIVLCGNKIDVRERKVKPKDITFHRKKNLSYFDISAKSNYNYEKPFLNIFSKIFNKNTYFIDEPAILPPEIKIGVNEKKNQNKLKIAENTPLPEEE
jgi:GTP-binding nuclear protein Ran